MFCIQYNEKDLMFILEKFIESRSSTMYFTVVECSHLNVFVPKIPILYFNTVELHMHSDRTSS